MPDTPATPPHGRARVVALRAVLLLVALGGGWAALALLTRRSPDDALFALNPLLPLLIAASAAPLVYFMVYRSQRRADVAEAQLRDREIRQHQIAELVGDFAYVLEVTPTGEPHLQWATLKVLATHTGRPLADLQQRATLNDLVHPDDRPLFKQRLASLINGQPFEGEFRFIDTTGREHWVHDRAQPVWNADQSRVTHIYGSSHEITERKQADLRLAASELRWRHLADSMLDLVSETDIAGRYTYASRSHEALLGYSASELIGSSVFDHIHPDDLPMARAAYQSSVQHRTSGRLEIRYRHRDSRYIWLETIGNLLLSPDDQIMGALFASRDITARKQADQALSRYARRLSALYQTSLVINSPSKLDTLLNEIVDCAMNMLGAEMGGVYLLEPDGHTLRLAANLPPDYLGTTLQIGEGLSGRVAQSGAPLVVADYAHWAGQADIFRTQTLGRVLAVPIKLADRILGVLTVEDREAGIFEDDDIRVINLLADQAAVAVENRRLMEQAQQEIAQRAEAEQALRESESRYRDLVENAGEGISFVDEHETFMDANPAAAEIYGLPRGQLTGRNLRDFTDETNYDLLRQQTEIRRSGQTSIYEHSIRRADGQLRYLLVTARPRRTADGTFLGTFAVFRDITERKEAERELARTRQDIARRNEQLTQILEAGNSIRLNLDLDAVLTEITHAARQALGFTMAALNTVNPEIDEMRLHSVVGNSADATDIAAHAGRAVYKWSELQSLLRPPFVRGRCCFVPAGQYDWTHNFNGPMWNALTHPHPEVPPALAWQPDDVLFVLVELRTGEIVGVIWVDGPLDGLRPSPDTLRALEIFSNQAAIAFENARLYQAAQRYAADLEGRVLERTAELEHERQQLQAILDAAGDSILLLDAAGRIQYTNRATSQNSGYAAAELLGQPIVSLNLEQSDALDTALWQGRHWYSQLVARRKDGTLFDAAVSLTPLAEGRRTITGFVAVYHDITQLKELDRLKNQFVARIGHELRTPVVNFKLYLDLLERGRPERKTHYLTTLQAETDRLRRLIDGFLEMSQLDAGAVLIRPSAVNLNQFLDDLLEDRAATAAERGLTLNIQPDHQLPQVITDRTLAAQIVRSLVENALSYTPAGGHITLSTGTRADNGQQWVTFTVRDTGPGLTPEEQTRVFERFYRGEAARTYRVSGAGLGLSIASEVARQINGRLTVDSRPGEGAAFTLWLKT